MYKLDLEKAGLEEGLDSSGFRGSRDQIANIHWIIEKAREFQKKTSISVSWTTIKPLTVCIITNSGKFLKR